MILLLRVWFILALATMLTVTVWASLQDAIWNIPAPVSHHPWFIATLFDTYFAFIAFFCWVAYKERSLAVKLFWLLAILALGNIAIASYCLIQLFRVPLSASLRDVLIRA